LAHDRRTLSLSSILFTILSAPPPPVSMLGSEWGDGCDVGVGTRAGKGAGKGQSIIDQCDEMITIVTSKRWGRASCFILCMASEILVTSQQSPSHKTSPNLAAWILSRASQERQISCVPSRCNLTGIYCSMVLGTTSIAQYLTAFLAIP
jgi:hypothetical protein